MIRWLPSPTNVCRCSRRFQPCEKGGEFAYFMQRSVVGAPGMFDEARAYYTDLFTKVYNSADWQAYKSKKSLMGDLMMGN